MKRRNFLYILFVGLAGIIGAAIGLRIPKASNSTSNNNAQEANIETSTNKSNVYKWKMVTSWPPNAPGTGAVAARLAKRINELSNNRIQIQLYAAGELVGGLEVFDAVSRGTAELGHTASFFWQGKTPLTAFFTAVPFGLNPNQHHSWLYQGGGQTLWDELYSPFTLKPFAAGNTGPSMGGWFKKPLDFNSAQPFKGLKIRMPGLGGKVIQRFGALAVSIPPTEIFTALQSGVIDAAELLAPWNDRAFGLHKLAKYCYYPGFHEPNGSAECLVNLEVYQSLPADLRLIIDESCRAECLLGLSESNWHNAIAMQQLRQEGVKFIPYPQKLLNAMQQVATEVIRDTATNPTININDTTQIGNRIYASYSEALRLTNEWEELQLRSQFGSQFGSQSRTQLK